MFKIHCFIFDVRLKQVIFKQSISLLVGMDTVKQIM